jgi:hypothetical protein
MDLNAWVEWSQDKTFRPVLEKDGKIFKDYRPE